MEFRDFESLKAAAKVHNFRQPRIEESEAEFREALANHVEPIDFVESIEIRTSRGHDQWNKRDSQDMLLRSMMKGFDKPKRKSVYLR